ncbi:MAG: hypothetical protein ACKPHU_35680 [Planctomycetaceae bacterium]
MPSVFSSADDFQGKVVGVADGDTVTVLRGKEQVKVRLDGVTVSDADDLPLKVIRRRKRDQGCKQHSEKTHGYFLLHVG